MNEHYSKFRTQLRAFLGLEEKNDTPYVRERPDYPCKGLERATAGRAANRRSRFQSNRSERQNPNRNSKHVFADDVPAVNPAIPEYRPASRTPGSSSSTSCR